VCGCVRSAIGVEVSDLVILYSFFEYLLIVKFLGHWVEVLLVVGQVFVAVFVGLMVVCWAIIYGCCSFFVLYAVHSI